MTGAKTIISTAAIATVLAGSIGALSGFVGRGGETTLPISDETRAKLILEKVVDRESGEAMGPLVRAHLQSLKDIERIFSEAISDGQYTHDERQAIFGAYKQLEKNDRNALTRAEALGDRDHYEPIFTRPPDHNNLYRGTLYQFEGEERRIEKDLKAAGLDVKAQSTREKSPCFLTTACVSHMGLPDDAYELETLRAFRDGVLMSSNRGRELVSEYYKIAPEIVQAVREKGSVVANQVWRSVYRDIRKAVGLIERGDFDGAAKHYQSMTTNLMSAHL